MPLQLTSRWVCTVTSRSKIIRADLTPLLSGIIEPVNRLERWANKLDAFAGVEARGIDRIPEELRERILTTKDYLQMFIM